MKHSNRYVFIKKIHKAKKKKKKLIKTHLNKIINDIFISSMQTVKIKLQILKVVSNFYHKKIKEVINFKKKIKLDHCHTQTHKNQNNYSTNLILDLSKCLNILF